MSLRTDLDDEIAAVFDDQWVVRAGQVVPAADDLKLGNDAVTLNGTVLYADMADSTGLVDGYKPHFAAEVYKAYLHCAAKVIRSEGGEITAYDGDRIMGVFIGERKNTSAVRAALKINWCRAQIVNPALRRQYPKRNYQVRHTIGIDTSDLWVSRTGIRGANDLVWVGRAANHAAKLCGVGSAEYPTWITAAVYNTMHESLRMTKARAMWEQRQWTAMDNRMIYRSNWWWALRS